MTKNHTIDAKGQKLGRIASQAAKLLMGKDSVTFVRHKAPDVSVTITNASKISFSEKRLTTKAYASFSGYPGSLKFEKLDNRMKRRGIEEIVRHAVRGMIPNNKLRPIMLKKLRVEN